MYTIYANDTLIHSPDLVSDGICVIGAVYEKEINKNGSLEFSIYSDNPYYNTLKNLKTVITVKEDGEEVWRGRILNTERTFLNCKSVYCEGVLSYFLDSVIRPFTHTKTMTEQFNYLIEKHNEEVEDYKKFTVDQITVDDPYGSIEWSESSYTKTKNLIDAILTKYGGYFVIKYVEGTGNVISYLKQPGTLNPQIIEFGENLLDITETLDSTSVFTVLIPIGYNSNNEKITIESVNEGKDYIESAEGIESYGKVVEQHTFDEDIETPQELLQKGITLLEDNIKASKTISISAIDLHMIDPSIHRFDIYDIIHVVSKEHHNIDEYEICSRVKIDINNPTQCEYVIGEAPEGITSMIEELKK